MQRRGRRDGEAADELGNGEVATLRGEDEMIGRVGGGDGQDGGVAKTGGESGGGGSAGRGCTTCGQCTRRGCSVRGSADHPRRLETATAMLRALCGPLRSAVV